MRSAASVASASSSETASCAMAFGDPVAASPEPPRPRPTPFPFAFPLPLPLFPDDTRIGAATRSARPFGPSRSRTRSTVAPDVEMVRYVSGSSRASSTAGDAPLASLATVVPAESRMTTAVCWPPSARATSGAARLVIGALPRPGLVGAMRPASTSSRAAVSSMRARSTSSSTTTRVSANATAMTVMYSSPRRQRSDRGRIVSRLPGARSRRRVVSG